ncbi:transmembrane ascorbate-dependent reductase CYB561-like isoform X2 [Daktulosphaira vitifoliae]|nr:transmembrane ascorbate-dependent reductase CYB561-like isoform X2 [Daktulosphaira vitifoliae]XP_050544160.1 transmembrane ascorbate-dependent reductase CYB561-like isoform X2 [Daktulosphaira vitifoliae]XP_050544161.1 transmembrane ascorbate-dependent reductase CYB561-like isoform X2 [Daktulosphaira vitifoliae]XP_050544162.1 transmembrane ascorbate-dependent reductase CYB561-like isoform X2 [Daktulosphaira vitifoliae]XP_050544163.1 transmembrane ascorbate-dependent reductase CYB561-like isof
MESNKNTLPVQNAADISGYTKIYTISQVIGIVIILAMYYWLEFYRGGFGFGAKVIFNWHPLLMTIGFIFFFANSILHYRTFRNNKKSTLKNQHAIIHGVIIILVLLAAWAAIASHIYASPPIPNFYSLHSWIGIITTLMFLCQFIGGFVSFLYPGISVQYRESLMPYHVYFGVLNFALAIGTSVLGLGEKVIFALDKEYKHLPAEAFVVNILGIVIAAYGAIVIYLVTKSQYKRIPNAESGVLLTGALE